MIGSFFAMLQFVVRLIGYAVLGITVASLLYYIGALAAIVPLVA